jgi:hypothetical protein
MGIYRSGRKTERSKEFYTAFVDIGLVPKGCSLASNDGCGFKMAIPIGGVFPRTT